MVCARKRTLSFQLHKKDPPAKFNMLFKLLFSIEQQCDIVTRDLFFLLFHPRIPSTKSTMASSTTSYVKSTAVSNPSIRFVDLPFVDFPYENNMNPTTSDTLRRKASPMSKKP